MNGGYRIFVLGLIAFLVLLATVTVIGAELKGIDANSTPLVVAVIGIVATAIPGLLALLRVEHVNQKIDEQNGHIAHLEDTAKVVQETSADAAQALRDLTAEHKGVTP